MVHAPSLNTDIELRGQRHTEAGHKLQCTTCQKKKVTEDSNEYVSFNEQAVHISPPAWVTNAASPRNPAIVRSHAHRRLRREYVLYHTHAGQWWTKCNEIEHLRLNRNIVELLLVRCRSM